MNPRAIQFVMSVSAVILGALSVIILISQWRSDAVGDLAMPPLWLGPCPFLVFTTLAAVACWGDRGVRVGFIASWVGIFAGMVSATGAAWDSYPVTIWPLAVASAVVTITLVDVVRQDIPK